MFPGTATAAVTLQRPTKIPPFQNTLVRSILDVLLIGTVELFTCTYRRTNCTRQQLTAAHSSWAISLHVFLCVLRLLIG